MKGAVLVFLIISASHLFAQRVINKEIPVNGEIFLTKSIAIPKIHKGYTVWLPEKEKINGLVVFIHGRRDTTQSDVLINYALSHQLAVMYATTDNRMEFFFEAEKMHEIESYIQEVLCNHAIPDTNMLYCGMSLEGTRVLRLTMFSQGRESKFRLKPKAIAICDAPLDMVRFHKSMVKAKELNFTDITANEGAWVSGYLESNLGGSPSDALTAYIDYSPFCYTSEENNNLQCFNDIAIRAYTEPDVNWWIETRGKDYYSMNSIDLAAMINQLKLNGNQSSELIITHNKGYHSDGTRHPHNWAIVDERELIDWFTRLSINK